jgi:Na+/H+ antiporter NhaC
MRLRTRLLAALVFFALFVLVPSADSPSDRAFLARLDVRAWLLDAAGPLASHARDGTLPPLAVDLRTSPPIADEAERRRQVAAYERLAAEWAAARTADGAATRVDPTRPPVPLLVRVGERGAQAELPTATGVAAARTFPFPSRIGLLPALLAITVAVLTQRVLLALLVACLAGAIAHVAGGADGALAAVLGGVEHFAVDALWRRSVLADFYLRITLFVVFLFMTVGLITRNGGVTGLVALLQRRVRGPVGAQLATFAAGLAVFFDDYTNCLLVGSTMRPLCDASRVSREKLAYVVDSTAAPIAGVSVFSTWILYEMSTYRAPLALVTRADGTPYVPDDAFAVFVSTLPYRCYCWFALAMVVLVAVMRRDFGPMLAAERRARAGVAPPPGSGDVGGLRTAPTASSPANALLPLAVLVLGTIGGMAALGIAATSALPPAPTASDAVQRVLANAQSDVALLVASIAAWLVASVCSLVGGRLGPREVLRTSLAATRTLWVPFGILFLAWSLGHLCSDLGTSRWLAASAREQLSPVALPVLLFVVAGGIAFATGTSFGTMAILLPNVVVLAHEVGAAAAFTGDPAAGGPALMLLCIGAVLEGAIFGDHCSPISDTTVLSSLGSGCGLLAHVATQLPYALLVFAVALSCGYLPLVLIGPHVWPACLLAGVLVLALALRLLGRDASAP